MNAILLRLTDSKYHLLAVYKHSTMHRFRDLESKEAYLHERRFTARKINKQREKRSNSSSSAVLANSQPINKLSEKKQRSKSVCVENTSTAKFLSGNESEQDLCLKDSAEEKLEIVANRR